MKTNLIVLLMSVLLIACESVNKPNNPDDDKPVNKTENVLIGEWAKINDANYIVSITDSLIQVKGLDQCVCQYTKDDNRLYIKRLWFEDTHPSFVAECGYSLRGDTLQIEQFEQTLAEIYPPQFVDITLIKR